MDKKCFQLLLVNCKIVHYYKIALRLRNQHVFFQVASLRLVNLGDGTADAKTLNWREKQALNDRTFTLWKTSSSASFAALISPPILLLAFLVNLIH